MIVKIKVDKRTFKIKDCKGLSSLRGLMFDDLEGKDGALIYANSIWMPFVRRDLNLIFLDERMRIAGNCIASPVTFNPKTWKIYKIDKAKYCLELKDCKLKVNEKTKVRLVR